MSDSSSAPLKILLWNLCYGTGITGAHFDYLLRWHRFLYTPQKIRQSVQMAIDAVIAAEHPAVCCFLEIHGTSGFVPHLRGYRAKISGKYGQRSMLSHLSFFRDNCNGFFAPTSLPYSEHFLRYGTKKLLFEVEAQPKFSVLFAHFSLSRNVRRKQFSELRELLCDRPNALLCGDFNTFDGQGEVQDLLTRCTLRCISPGPTFPASHPRFALDYFLCPAHLAERATVYIPRVPIVSDHLPVILELR